MFEERHQEENRSEEVSDIAKEFNFLPLEWGQKHTLKTFAQNLQCPQPILICKGKYENCGHPTPSEPDLTARLIAWCKRSRRKIKAQYVRFEDEDIRQVGPLHEIDDDYEGWFEIVSEVGKEMSCIQTVAELTRWNGKTFVLMKSMHAHQRTSEGEWESCTLHIGYRIRVGEEILTDGLPDASSELLRCESVSEVLWEISETVYLPLEGSGRFALIPENDLLVGPKRVSFFSACVMMPINVKVMEGSPPPCAVRLRLLTPYMRIYSSHSEQVLTALPVLEGAPFVHIPIASEMELKVLDNLEHVQEMSRYHKILRHVQKTIIPQIMIKVEYRHHLPRIRYLCGWFYPKTEETSEGRGYDHPFILASKEDNDPSVETRSIKPCVEQHTCGLDAVHKDKSPPLRNQNERSSEEVLEPLKLYDPQKRRVPYRYIFDLAASPSEKVRAMETGTWMQPSVEQRTSRISTDHLEKNHPLNIKQKNSKDIQPTPKMDGGQIKRRRSEPIKKVQQTSSPSVQPSNVRRSLRIRNLQQKADQQQQSSGIDTDLTQ